MKRRDPCKEVEREIPGVSQEIKAVVRTTPVLLTDGI